jgi:predicted ribosomally synthesized peptide with SipW-like signal peptide
MKTRNIAIFGAIGVAALALIGAGTAATFTTSTTSSQTITSGSLSVTASAEGATGNGSVGNPLILPAVGPTQSTFVTSIPVTVTNTGNIPATEINLGVGATNNGTSNSIALQGEMWACLSSGSTMLFNEPLNTAAGYGTFAVGATTLAVGGTDNYTLTLYAGSPDGGCGAAFTAISGGAFQPSPTQSIVAGATNPATAAGLDNAAESGVVSATVTMTYSG